MAARRLPVRPFRPAQAAHAACTLICIATAPRGPRSVIRAPNLRPRRPPPWSRVGRASAGGATLPRHLARLVLPVAQCSAAFAFEIGDWPTPLSYRQQQRQHRGVPASALMPAFPGTLPGAAADWAISRHWCNARGGAASSAAARHGSGCPSARNALQGFPDPQQALLPTVSWFEQNGGSSLLREVRTVRTTWLVPHALQPVVRRGVRDDGGRLERRGADARRLCDR